MGCICICGRDLWGLFRSVFRYRSIYLTCGNLERCLAPPAAAFSVFNAKSCPNDTLQTLQGFLEKMILCDCKQCHWQKYWGQICLLFCPRSITVNKTIFASYRDIGLAIDGYGMVPLKSPCPGWWAGRLGMAGRENGHAGFCLLLRTTSSRKTHIVW